MDANVNPWASEWAKEIFLSIAASPKTQKEIIADTDYPQSHVSRILGVLSKEKFIVERGDLLKRNGRRPESVWDICPERLFEKLVYPKNPFFAKANMKPGQMGELVGLMRRYLGIVATNPLWRNDYWIEHQERFKKYTKWVKSKWGGKTKVERNWQDYKKQNTIYGTFNLEQASKNFLEYLLYNRNYLNEKQREQMMDLVDWYHLSLESDYLRDPDLNNKN